MHLHAINGDSCAPGFAALRGASIVADAFEAALSAADLAKAVVAVLAVRYESQIFSAVIETVVIDVVDFVARALSEQKSVQRCYPRSKTPAISPVL